MSDVSGCTYRTPLRAHTCCVHLSSASDDSTDTLICQSAMCRLHHTHAVPAGPHASTAVEAYAGRLGVHPTFGVFSDSKLSSPIRGLHQEKSLKGSRVHGE